MRRLTVLTLAWCLAWSVSVAKAEELKPPFSGQINSDSINIRTDSTVSSTLIIKANTGVYVNVVSESYDWYKIQLPKASPSYIKKTLVTPLSEKSVKVIKDTVNIRLGPAETMPILGKAHRDEVLTVVQDAGEWYRIVPVANSYGWVNKKYVSKIVPVAAQQLAQAQTIPGAAAVENPIVKDDNIIAEGIVKPHGVIFKRKATHKLICNQDKIYLLKGDKKTLDALNHRKVRVLGKITGAMTLKYPIIEIEKVEAQD